MTLTNFFLMATLAICCFPVPGRAQSTCQSLPVVVHGSQDTAMLRLCHRRTDNGEPRVRLTYREEWTLVVGPTCSPPDSVGPPVLWQSDKSWTSLELTVSQRRAWLSLSEDQTHALIVIAWLEGTDAGGAVFAVDVFRVGLDSVAPTERGMSTEPFARLRRPTATSRTVGDVLVGATALTIISDDIAMGRIEWQLDLRSGEWHDVGVSDEPVPGIVERKSVRIAIPPLPP